MIYEAHVKGHDREPSRASPARARGTFEGLGSPQVVEHLAKLGVTAIELMPIQAFFDDRHLVEKGLANYWGYNTIGFFAPAPRYLMPGNDIAEFKHMVQRLHEAGIEVILDVVYNHTAEGNQLGPTLSLPRPRQRQLLRARRRPALLFRHHRLRQHRQPPPSAGGADGDGLACATGSRTATSTASASTSR